MENRNEKNYDGKEALQRGSYHDLAQYLVREENFEVWKEVLLPDNEEFEFVQKREAFFHELIYHVITQTDNPEEVALAIRALMTHNFREVLVELSEFMIFYNEKSIYSENRNLQNLLILNAFRLGYQERVHDYISRLTQYDQLEIAHILSESSDFTLAAMEIYRNAAKSGEEFSLESREGIQIRRLFKELASNTSVEYVNGLLDQVCELCPSLALHELKVC